jgi:hypothetical protein
MDRQSTTQRDPDWQLVTLDSAPSDTSQIDLHMRTLDQILSLFRGQYSPLAAEDHYKCARNHAIGSVVDMIDHGVPDAVKSLRLTNDQWIIVRNVLFKSFVILRDEAGRHQCDFDRTALLQLLTYLNSLYIATVMASQCEPPT